MSKNNFLKKSTDGGLNHPSPSPGNVKKKIKLDCVINEPELFSQPDSFVQVQPRKKSIADGKAKTMIESQVDSKTSSLSTEPKTNHPELVTNQSSETDTECLQSKNQFKTLHPLKYSESNNEKVSEAKGKDCCKTRTDEIKESSETTELKYNIYSNLTVPVENEKRKTYQFPVIKRSERTINFISKNETLDCKINTEKVLKLKGFPKKDFENTRKRKHYNTFSETAGESISQTSLDIKPKEKKLKEKSYMTYGNSEPNIKKVLELCRTDNLPIDSKEAIYYIFSDSCYETSLSSDFKKKLESTDEIETKATSHTQKHKPLSSYLFKISEEDSSWCVNFLVCAWKVIVL